MRIVLIGNNDSGKTSLFEAMLGRPFKENVVKAPLEYDYANQSTPDESYRLEKTTLGGVEVELVDTTSHRNGGGRMDASVKKLFNYQGAHVVIFCIDPLGDGDMWNFERLYEPEIHQVAPWASIILAVTKVDLEDNCPAGQPESEGIQANFQFARRDLVDYPIYKNFDVSAKTGRNVRDLIETCIQEGKLAVERQKTLKPLKNKPATTRKAKANKNKNCTIL